MAGAAAVSEPAVGSLRRALEARGDLHFIRDERRRVRNLSLYKIYRI